MKGNDKESKSYRITPSLEVLIWLIVIFLFVSFSSMTYITKEKNDNDYHIYLQDVDGLIVGSPVRMLGIEVGHVVKIKPVKDEVYVKFILTNQDVFVPQGTVATVEFTGMAGSKSLELYLPDKKSFSDKAAPLLETSQPKRLHDALDLLNQMYKKLNSIIFSVSTFGSKVDLDFNELKSKTGGSFNEFIDFSNNFIEDSGKKIYSIDTTIKEMKNAKQVQ